jgi:PAS domain S-box-containing protein
MRHYVQSLDETAECVFNADSNNRIQFSNFAATQVLHKSPSEIGGHSIFEVLFQKEEDRNRAIQLLDSEGSLQSEFPYVLPNGSPRILEVNMSRIEQPGNDDIALVSIVRDITQRKQTEEELSERAVKLEEMLAEAKSDLEKQLSESAEVEASMSADLKQNESLLKDIHDRVSDNLQMFASLLNIQSTKLQDPQSLKLLDDNQQRLKSVALVHENLFNARNMNRVDMSSYIDALASGLYRKYAPDGVNVHFDKDVDEFFLNLDQAVPCGLIINELVTNALEHGLAAKKLGSGNLRLKLYESGEECVLEVSDDGPGLPPEFNAEVDNSMGLEIVTILASQLGGQLKLVGGLGTTIEVRFPIDSKQDDLNE